MIELREKFHWVLYSNFLVTRVEMSGARVVHGLGWVGLGWVSQLMGWVGSGHTKWTTLSAATN